MASLVVAFVATQLLTGGGAAPVRSIPIATPKPATAPVVAPADGRLAARTVRSLIVAQRGYGSGAGRDLILADDAPATVSATSLTFADPTGTTLGSQVESICTGTTAAATQLAVTVADRLEVKRLALFFGPTLNAPACASPAATGALAAFAGGLAAHGITPVLRGVSIATTADGARLQAVATAIQRGARSGGAVDPKTALVIAPAARGLSSDGVQDLLDGTTAARITAAVGSAKPLFVLDVKPVRDVLAATSTDAAASSEAPTAGLHCTPPKTDDELEACAVLHGKASVLLYRGDAPPPTGLAGALATRSGEAGVGRLATALRSSCRRVTELAADLAGASVSAASCS